MNGGGNAGVGAFHSEDDLDDYSAATTAKPMVHYGPGGSNALSMSSAGMSSTSATQGPSSAFGVIASQTAAVGSQRGGVNTCCLLDEARRCQRMAGNASYSKRVQKTVYYKRLKLDVDTTAHHTYICDHHKNVIQNARLRAKKDSDDEPTETTEDSPEVDLYQLQVNTLRRYKKHFKIPTRPGLNKAQLADTLTKHFKTIPINEKEAVTYFIYSIKSGRNKLDNRQADGIATNDYLDRY